MRKVNIAACGETLSQPLRLTSLKNVCRAQDTPYYEAGIGDSYGALVGRSVSEVKMWQAPTPYVYCGLAQDVTVFAGTYLYTRGGEYVFHRQSLENAPKPAAFKLCADAFIESRRDALFTSFIEEECIYLGGIGMTPDAASATGFAPAMNFGQFVFEFLNRMVIFEMYGLAQRLPLVVCDEVPEAWIDFIELAGGSRDRMIRVPAGRAAAYRKVWVASSCHHRDQDGNNRFWAAGLHWLRYKLWQSIGGPKLERCNRIYISGDGARRMANEAEVIAALARYGIEHLPISQLSARAQVEIVSGAEIAVYADDAMSVMANFAPEHCVTIVLNPPQAGDGMWSGPDAAAFLRQPFERLAGEAMEGRGGSAGFKVDIAALQGLIDAGLRLLETSRKRDAIQI